MMQIEYPEIEDLAKPRHRFMSSYEQVNSGDFVQLRFSSIVVSKYAFVLMFFSLFVFWWLQRVQPFDKRYQYLLFAAEPYEIVAFKVFCYSCLSICFGLYAFILAVFFLLWLWSFALCSLSYIFRCPARRLISPLQSFSRTGIRTQRCSRLVHVLLLSVCDCKLDICKCLCVLWSWQKIAFNFTRDGNSPCMRISFILVHANEALCTSQSMQIWSCNLYKKMV